VRTDSQLPCNHLLECVEVAAAAAAVVGGCVGGSPVVCAGIRVCLWNECALEWKVTFIRHVFPLAGQELLLPQLWASVHSFDQHHTHCLWSIIDIIMCVYIEAWPWCICAGAAAAQAVQSCVHVQAG